MTTKEQLSAAITNKYGLDRKMSKKYAAIIDAGRITNQVAASSAVWGSGTLPPHDQFEGLALLDTDFGAHGHQLEAWLFHRSGVDVINTAWFPMPFGRFRLDGIVRMQGRFAWSQIESFTLCNESPDTYLEMKVKSHEKPLFLGYASDYLALAQSDCAFCSDLLLASRSLEVNIEKRKSNAPTTDRAEVRGDIEQRGPSLPEVAGQAAPTEAEIADMFIWIEGLAKVHDLAVGMAQSMTDMLLAADTLGAEDLGRLQDASLDHLLPLSQTVVSAAELVNEAEWQAQAVHTLAKISGRPGAKQEDVIETVKNALRLEHVYLLALDLSQTLDEGLHDSAWPDRLNQTAPKARVLALQLERSLVMARTLAKS